MTFYSVQSQHDQVQCSYLFNTGSQNFMYLEERYITASSNKTSGCSILNNACCYSKNLFPFHDLLNPLRYI